MKRIFNKVLAISLMCAMVFSFVSFTSLAVEVTEATEDAPTTVEVEVEELASSATETTEDVLAIVGVMAEELTPSEIEDRIIMDFSVIAPTPAPQFIVGSLTWIQATLNEGIGSVRGSVGVYFGDEMPTDTSNVLEMFENVLWVPADSDLVTITGLNTSQLGWQMVTVNVFGLTATVGVMVSSPWEEPLPNENEPQSMQAWSIGTVFQGQTPEFQINLFDGPFGSWPDGNVFPTGEYIRTVIATPEMISGFNPEQLGEQTVTVTYQELTATATVFVFSIMPGESWEFSRLGTLGVEGWTTPPGRTIMQGRSIGDLNMHMIFWYSVENSFPRQVAFPICESTKGMTITGIDTSLVGQQDMTITFGGFTQTVRIIVVANPNLTDSYCEFCEGEGCEVCEEPNGGGGTDTGNGNNGGTGTGTGNGNNGGTGTSTGSGNNGGTETGTGSGNGGGTGTNVGSGTGTPNNQASNIGSASPRTGDERTLLPFISGALFSLSAIFGVTAIKKKEKN